jgi:hypothetical protein
MANRLRRRHVAVTLRAERDTESRGLHRGHSSWLNVLS